MNYDVVVIGGGILGCFAARNLMKYALRAAIVEAAEDVCTGITRANSAMVYPGYDMKPSTLKAAMAVAGAAQFPDLCRELEIPLHTCGSIMAACGGTALETLNKKYRQGLESGIPDLELWNREQLLEREPLLGELVSGGLYAPTAATVNPWQLGIAAWENAVANGCAPLLSTPILGIDRCRDGYILKTPREEISCRAVLNCAGMSADRIQELLFPPSIQIVPDGADYLVLDAEVRGPSCAILFETDTGKGITAIPCPEGNLMIASPPRPLDTHPLGTNPQGLADLQAQLRQLLPGLPSHRVIRSFSALRPNPYQVHLEDGQVVREKKSIHSFAITNPGPGFYSLIGIKTPGITCAQELGMYLAKQAADYLQAGQNSGFSPRREAIVRVHDLPLRARQQLAARDPDFGEVVCMCQDVTCGEIRQAIARGASTVDGVKRRVGTSMGPCQGSRCTRRIEALLEERPC